MSKDTTTKTFGLRDDDFQMMHELNITANNIKRHMAAYLTMVARDRFHYKETDNLLFEVDWKSKQLIIREQEADANSETEEGR